MTIPQMVPLTAALAVVSSAIDVAPLWEIAKGVMLFSCTALLTWCAATLRQVLRTLIDHQHILIGVDGTNGLRSKVRGLEDEVDAIKERNLKIDAVTESERRQHPGPDRRVGARRLRDVAHEALDEHAHRATDEFPTTEEHRR
jgi:hypothetical protein